VRHGAARIRSRPRGRAAALAAGLCPLPLAAQGPLSAIEWLQDSVLVPDPDGLQPVTPPTGDAWMDGVITMRPLDRVQPDAVGLFPAARVGLPRDFWQPSTAEELAPLVADLPEDTLPALRTLAYRLLLAEFDAPRATRPTRRARRSCPRASTSFTISARSTRRWRCSIRSIRAMRG
jgi:hypothetical protein